MKAWAALAVFLLLSGCSTAARHYSCPFTLFLPLPYALAGTAACVAAEPPPVDAEEAVVGAE